MDDKQIIELFWGRLERAIVETEKKYGRYCHFISYHILQNEEDAKECVNDTLIKAWNSIPPNRPGRLAAFLGKITRNLSLDRYQRQHAKKRDHGRVTVALDELADCLPGTDNVSHYLDHLILQETLNTFLWSLSTERRIVFMRRYWYFSTIKEIASDLHISESKVKMLLLRTRNDLKEYLMKEGVAL